MYLAIRSDKPEAELYVLSNDGHILKQKIWDAGRTLARDLPGKVDELMNNNYDQLKGVMVYKGPGSFTGLRIGITVANAIAYGKSVAAVGVAGDDWLAGGVAKLNEGVDDKIVLPEYGAAPHITPPRK